MKVEIKLKQLREERQLSLRDVEKKTGVGRSAISKIEIGESDPKVSTVAKLALGLGCKLQDIINIQP